MGRGNLSPATPYLWTQRYVRKIFQQPEEMMAENHDATIVSGGRPAARFVVKQGPQIGITFPILQNQTHIGREESNDVRVQDAEVSRKHSELLWKDEIGRAHV